MTEVTIWLTQILFVYLFYFKDFFFLCGSFLKSLLNLLQYCFLFFMFWFIFFGCTAHRILAFWPRIEPVSPALKGEGLTTGPPGKTQAKEFLELTFTILVLFLVLLYEIFVLFLSQVPYRKLLKTWDSLEWQRVFCMLMRWLVAGCPWIASGWGLVPRKTKEWLLELFSLTSWPPWRAGGWRLS